MKHVKLFFSAPLLALQCLLLSAAAFADTFYRRTWCLYEAPPSDIKALHEATEKALKAISDQVKEAGDKALAEAKKTGDMSAEMKPKVDELLVKQGELQARLQDVEQKIARRNAAEAPQHRSPGAMVVESAEFKAYIKAGNFRQGFNYGVKAIVTDITSDMSSGGDLVVPQRQPGIIAPPERRMTVRDLITPGTTGSNLVQYIRESGYTNSAATVSETTAKPKSDITFEMLQAAVVKIATYVKASTEILADAAMLQSYIDNRLRYMLAYVEEAQLLNGSGVGNNLNGIYTQATAYSAPITPPGTLTKVDVLRLMMLQAELALYPATGVVLHPNDWCVIELLKDEIGRYIIGNPQGTITPTIWGRPVVATQAMTVDTALVGAFKLGAQVFDRLQANVSVATENEDDFIKNMVTILAEERLALAVYRPEAFIKNADLPAT